jgi:hypothetical protein
MLDGLEIADRTQVVALGISTEGVKIPLGLWEGSTENATLVGTLADLVDRALDPEQAILLVIDGGNALRKAIKDVFGQHGLVHRCHRRYPDLRVIPTRVDDSRKEEAAKPVDRRLSGGRGRGARDRRRHVVACRRRRPRRGGLSARAPRHVGLDERSGGPGS